MLKIMPSVTLFCTFSTYKCLPLLPLYVFSERQYRFHAGYTPAAYYNYTPNLNKRLPSELFGSFFLKLKDLTTGARTCYATPSL
jgi:hypothetical protein